MRNQIQQEVAAGLAHHSQLNMTSKMTTSSSSTGAAVLQSARKHYRKPPKLWALMQKTIPSLRTPMHQLFDDVFRKTVTPLVHPPSFTRSMSWP